MKENSSTVQVKVTRVGEQNFFQADADTLAVEEPLEIRVGYCNENEFRHKSISITMRTPSANRQEDFELAAGFLFTEGIISSAEQINKIFHCGVPLAKSSSSNTVRVDLNSNVSIDLQRLERHFYTNSSCGVCGKTSIESLYIELRPMAKSKTAVFETKLIHRLPQLLRLAQNVFEQTGGLHAAALFDAAGDLQAVREDVGRHNAVDKLIGSQLLGGKLPLNEYLIFVSGRASFELIQKALAAGIPLMAAVGAPSSLAVELADKFGMTLLGFVRDNRFNIYTHPERVEFSKSV